MPDKKPADPEKSERQKALEARIDAMLKPDQSESVAVPVRKNSAATAPEVPKKMLKEIPDDKPDDELDDKPDDNANDDLNDNSDTDAVSDETETPAAVSDKPDKSAPLDDKETDKAVEDIVSKEGDIVLAVEDAGRQRRAQTVVSSSSWKDKLRYLAGNKRLWIGVAVILIVLFGLPLTRYKILGLVIKRPVNLTIVDSKTKTPVSNAEVTLGSASGKTDGSGKVQLQAPVGSDNLTVEKQYYTTAHSSHFVGFKTAPSSSVSLVATGRLVPVSVVNKITGQPLKGAEIQVLKTTAKTDAKGVATIALPASNSQEKAKVSFKGYNQATASITVTDKVLKTNSIELTPSGHIYFLSNLHGSLDVVKTNLDGSDRHIVLEGTGKEDKLSTSLLASRDWHYLVLKARRDSDQAALYLIDTATDKVTQFDNGNADFSLIGWYGHSFIYSLTRSALSPWQSGREVVKSYDAENLQLNQLDQTQAEGDADSYIQQYLSNFYIVNGALVYSTQWNDYSGFAPDLSGKSNTIRAINPNGQNKKDYQSFHADGTSFTQAVLYKPQAVYFGLYSGGDKTDFFEYENQTVKLAGDVDQNAINQGYPTYLLSPSGTKTFWTELRDGKNTLFVGDDNADHQKQIASLSDYSPYGWYGDNYVLVSKNSSELYVMPASGPTAKKPPLKLTDYYKPAQTFNGYGYGYGGL